MKPLAVALALLASSALADVDVYDFKMRIKVPRIYDNAQSKGERRWQTQLICGEMHVDYDTNELAPVVTFKNCINRSHVIDGKPVTYLCEQGYDEVIRRWVVMGSNRTGLFRDGSCFFFADFEPSYNVGDDEPDNSLLLYFGGYGTLQKVQINGCPCLARTCGPYAQKVKRWSGYCVGTMGCGCRAYGHVSPTRVLGFCGVLCGYVTDVAAIPKGQWYAIYRYSY